MDNSQKLLFQFVQTVTHMIIIDTDLKSIAGYSCHGDVHHSKIKKSEILFIITHERQLAMVCVHLIYHNCYYIHTIKVNHLVEDFKIYLQLNFRQYYKI